METNYVGKAIERDIGMFVWSQGRGKWRGVDERTIKNTALVLGCEPFEGEAWCNFPTEAKDTVKVWPSRQYWK